MAGARQMIAVRIAFRKSNDNSLERQVGAWRGGGGVEHPICNHVLGEDCLIELNSRLWGSHMTFTGITDLSSIIYPPLGQTPLQNDIVFRLRICSETSVPLRPSSCHAFMRLCRPQ